MSDEFAKRKELNRQLRERSGAIDGHSALASFLYTLLRDYQQPGDVEQLVTNTLLEDETIQYSNGYLAQYAGDLAHRLLAKERQNMAARAALAYEYFVTAKKGAPEYSDKTHFVNVVCMLINGEFPK